MLEKYKDITFRRDTLAMIDGINRIIDDYLRQGYVLTVRQLYYQLVARDVLANNEKNYKYVTRIVNDGRVAGLIDWDAIEDRTRSFERRGRWDDPRDIFYASAQQYHTDPWATQDRRVFLVVEKEALVGVFQRVCHEYDVPLLAARGYPSASVVREFAKKELEDTHEEVLILHFGDHDPSGIDMTRDLEERFRLFGWNASFELKRLALNFDQVEEHQPPPNPAKSTDARFASYRKKHGASSWELDALQPELLASLARDEITDNIDEDEWARWSDELAETKVRMSRHADAFKG